MNIISIFNSINIINSINKLMNNRTSLVILHGINTTTTLVGFGNVVDKGFPVAETSRADKAGRTMYDISSVFEYFCPGSLSCVYFPHHCPCAFPDVEDKFELATGSAICVSKGGWKLGEAARKVELARKGLL